MKNITPHIANTYNISKIHSVIFAILITSATRTYAQEAYAAYENGTLTFYYDNDRASHGTTYDLNKRTGTSNSGEALYSTPGWYEKTDISKVVFDASFSDARPTTCYQWFDGLSALKYCVGMENFNTSEVTSMERMFKDCSALTTLDLSNFDTYYVTNTVSMFEGCSSMAAICVTEDDDHWNLSRVNRSDNMFSGCDKFFSNTPLLAELFWQKYDKSVAKTGSYGVLTRANVKYNVTFVVDGNAYKTITYGVCKTVAIPDFSTDYPTTDEDHILDGWYDDGTCEKKYDFSQGITHDISLFAKYDMHKDYVTVIFKPCQGANYNSGWYNTTITGDTVYQTFACGKVVSLESNKYVKKADGNIVGLLHHTANFRGWSTSCTNSDCASINYSDKQIVSFSEPRVIELYPVWCWNNNNPPATYHAFWYKNDGSEDDVIHSQYKTGSNSATLDNVPPQLVKDIIS